MLTREIVRKLIESFSPKSFADVVKAACAPATFVAASRVLKLGKGLPDVAVLGVVRDLPGTAALSAPLLVADVSLGDKPLTERSSRIMQFKAARKALEAVCTNPPVPVDGIIVQGVFAFHGADGAFRVSLVTASASGGKLVWSQVKRQSFYVTPDPDANATFVQRMTANWSSLAAIKEAFSVEKLTKEFYQQLFKWYERACDDKRVEYPNDLATDKDNREDNNRKHLLRLITRLMFVWFLKQKGLVPDDLFDEEALKKILKDFNPIGKKQNQYYRAILQNLFFATLNSEIEEREFADTATPNKKGEKPTTKHHGVKTKYRYAEAFNLPKKDVVDLFHKIPFLNGGLFECLDQEGDDGKVMYYDGFSQTEYHRDHGTLTWARVPNDLFFDPDSGLIPLLKRYNFTVEENTPGDEDVALDPELLGKVFENLLGAYNPETKEIVRKSVGAFYTPREIVNYMVDESLVAYLAGKAGGRGRPDSTQTVRALVKDGVRPDDEALCKKLIAAIESAKVLDPACGSGAFPMGALLKMTELLRVLKKLPEAANLYDLKLQLIENCIFGVDIQEIAVQISKLRFFISLVCEQKPDWNAPNYGINTLPNLETKFVAANSLIGLKRTDAKYDKQALSQSDLFYDAGDIQKIKDALWEVRHRHFLAKTRKEKNALRKQDKELRTKLANRGKELGFSTESTKLMASWDPYNQNIHAEFFEPDWMFNVRDGFDIVIGNPPYVKLETIKEQSKILEKEKYSVYTKRSDLYCLFTERGINLLAKNGVISYIMSNKWLQAEYGRPLRQLLRTKRIRMIIDFGDIQIFEGATTYPCIFVLSNAEASKDFWAISLEKYSRGSFEKDIVGKASLLPTDKLTDEAWVLNIVDLSLLERVRTGLPMLMEIVGDNIYRGILTGATEAFVVDSTIKDKIVSVDKTCKDVFVPIVRGRDIKKYSVAPSDMWLIGMHNGYEDMPPLDIRKYKEIKKWLDRFEDKLEDRTDQGCTKYNLRDCAYWNAFLQPKIMYQTFQVSPGFVYDESGLYCNNSMWIIPTKEKGLVGLLNSKMGWWLISKYCTQIQNGYQLIWQYLSKIPVPKKLPSELGKLVEKILSAKKKDAEADMSALEREIDGLVYDLYGLTKEEREIVEKSVAKPEKAAKGGGAVADAEAPVAKPSAKKPKAKKPQFKEEF